jgi:hypothetical protein
MSACRRKKLIGDNQSRISMRVFAGERSILMETIHCIFSLTVDLFLLGASSPIELRQNFWSA